MCLNYITKTFVSGHIYHENVPRTFSETLQVENSQNASKLCSPLTLVLSENGLNCDNVPSMYLKEMKLCFVEFSSLKKIVSKFGKRWFSKFF